MIDKIEKDEARSEGKAAEPVVGKIDKTVMPASEKKIDALKNEKARQGLEGVWMYVGPTLPGIGIQNRVYTQIPEEAQNRAKETPEIRLLFIPVKDYPMANRMLREKFGYIYNAYCKAEETRKGGNAQ